MEGERNKFGAVGCDGGNRGMGESPAGRRRLECDPKMKKPWRTASQGLLGRWRNPPNCCLVAWGGIEPPTRRPRELTPCIRLVFWLSWKVLVYQNGVPETSLFGSVPLLHKSGRNHAWSGTASARERMVAPNLTTRIYSRRSLQAIGSAQLR